MQVRFKNIATSLRKHQSYILLFTGFVFIVFGALVATASDNGTIKTSVSIVPSTTPATTVAPTTTTSTTVVTTTTTIPVDWNAVAASIQLGIDEARGIWGKCGEWHDLAIQVGWPEEEWPRLQEIIWRESRCDPNAWNGADAGLVQINRVHQTWLTDFGWSFPDDMFIPEKNLTFALALWKSSGWKPWRFSGTTWGD